VIEISSSAFKDGKTIPKSMDVNKTMGKIYPFQ